MNNRIVTLEEIKIGLRSFFEHNDYSRDKIATFKVGYHPNKIEKLAENTGISCCRIENFFEIAYNLDVADENLFPKADEFEIMLSADKCEHPDVLRLKKLLDDELSFLIKRKQIEEYNPYNEAR